MSRAKAFTNRRVSEIAPSSRVNWSDFDLRQMGRALELARLAEAGGEVPVGAVLVLDDVIVGEGRNSPIAAADPTAHAEMQALREAARGVANYRLSNSTMYVTLEPCVMCAGALIVARVKRLVFGARDLRFGAVRSKFQLADSPLLNHRLEIEEGLLAAESGALLETFFAQRRK